MSEKLAWRALTLVMGAAAAALTRSLIARMWESSGHSPAPVNPADRRADWGEAVAWGVAAGIGAGIARVIGQRSAASVWEQIAGGPPPGVRT